MRWLLAAALVVSGCGGEAPATRFCDGYADALRPLVAAARTYDPAEFDRTLESTLTALDRLRAPDERLRSALDTASFTFTVFGSPERLAEFLTRADFSDNAVVLACAEYGVEITPAGR